MQEPKDVAPAPLTEAPPAPGGTAQVKTTGHHPGSAPGRVATLPNGEAPPTDEPEQEARPHVNLGREFRDMENSDVKLALQQMAADHTSAQVATSMKEHGIPRDQARSLLKEMYPGINDTELDDITRGFGEVEPAPWELAQGDEEELRKFGERAEKIAVMEDGPKKEAAMKGLHESFAKRFGERAGKTLGKFITFALLGSILSFLALMILHTSGNK